MPQTPNENGPRFIFVTGGVVSSLGKGIAAASIGRLLVARGLDGRAAEVRPVHQRRPRDDVALPARRGVRHRGRRRDRPRPRPLRALHRREHDARVERHRRRHLQRGDPPRAPRRLPRRDRPGDPAHHRRDQAARSADGRVDATSTSSITEIGGTVGDIESLPFLEAIRQFPVDVGRRRCMFIHLTLVPYISHAGELKTKPTQHSVNELRRIGIQPDMLVCRSERRSRRDIREQDRAVREPAGRGGRLRPTTSPNIYRVPAALPRRGRRRLRPRALRRSRPRPPTSTTGASSSSGRRVAERDCADRARRQVRQARGRLPVGRRGAAPRRHPPRLPGRDRLGRLRGGRRDGGAAERLATPTAS